MSKTVLVVEDNALVVEMYRSALKSLGVTLIEARNGDEALKALQLHAPDLVIMDILLPGPSGYEILKQLKGHPKAAHVPVLAVTNTAAAADSVKLQEAGFSALIPKPINIQHFIDTVARYLPG
jgi:CheY-like chemotaxis protein